DLAHGDPQVGARTGDEDLARTGDRPGHGGGKLLGLLLEARGHCVHRHRPWVEGRSGGAGGRRLAARRGRRIGKAAKLPYAGMSRIRFEGSVSTAPWRGTPASGAI